MSLPFDFEDQTTGFKAEKKDMRERLAPGIEQIMTAMRTISLGVYLTDPLKSYGETEKVVCLLEALRRAFHNVYSDAKESGIVVGIDDDGHWLVPKGWEDDEGD